LVGLFAKENGNQSDGRTDGIHEMDFELVQMIGSGSFGSVYCAKRLSSSEYVAFKCISKADIRSETDIDVIFCEKDGLKMTNECPYIVKILSAFQNKSYIFLVMEFLVKGSVFSRIFMLWLFLKKKFVSRFEPMT
jgi:serine/threonine protein kinase